MKPIKNHIYCYGCRRNKMVFETKSKADNFIKFNSEEIKQETGFAPIRSYYCEFCCAYHVTSMPETAAENLNTRDKQNINIIFDFIDKRKKAKNKKTSKNKQATPQPKSNESIVLINNSLTKMQKYLDKNKNTDFIDETKLCYAYFQGYKLASNIKNFYEKLEEWLITEDITEENKKIVPYYKRLKAILNSAEDKGIDLKKNEIDLGKIHEAKAITYDEYIKEVRERNKKKIVTFESRILTVISKMEEIISAIKEKNTKHAENLIRQCYNRLNSLQQENSTVIFLKAKLDKWSDAIYYNDILESIQYKTL